MLNHPIATIVFAVSLVLVLSDNDKSGGGCLLLIICGFILLF